MQETSTDALQLQLLADQHAAPLLELVNKNRELLRTWLPWVDRMQTVSDFQRYIQRCQDQLQSGTDIGYAILVNGKVAGRIGLHYINQQNKSAAIGYWLAQEYFGRGLATAACRVLLQEAFNKLQLNRIEIKCATGNEKSAAVAVRLGFTKEAVLRQAEWVNGRAIDLALYSLLKSEWKN